MAFYLADMRDRTLFAELGFSSIEAYAHQNLGLAPSTTRQLIATSRALEELPIVEAAFVDRRLPWSVVRALVRVAVPETEVEWARWAEGRRVREVEAYCRRFQKGDRPTDPRRRRIHVPKVAVRALLGPVQLEVWNTARAKLEAELGTALTDAEVVMEAAKIVLGTQVDGSTPGRTKAQASGFQVVVHHCDSCRRRSVSGIDLEECTLDELALLPDENERPPVPLAERDIPTPESMRFEVVARDGGRCICCESRSNVTAHHKVWRERGGRTTPTNLLTLCERCHSLVHGRLLVIRGEIGGRLGFYDANGRVVRVIDPTPLETEITQALGEDTAAAGAGPVEASACDDSASDAPEPAGDPRVGPKPPEVDGQSGGRTVSECPRIGHEGDARAEGGPPPGDDSSEEGEEGGSRNPGSAQGEGEPFG